MRISGLSSQLPCYFLVLRMEWYMYVKHVFLSVIKTVDVENLEEIYTNKILSRTLIFLIKL